MIKKAKKNLSLSIVIFLLIGINSFDMQEVKGLTICETLYFQQVVCCKRGEGPCSALDYTHWEGPFYYDGELDS